MLCEIATTTPRTKDIREAAREIAANRWAGTRAEARNRCQLGKALDTLCEVAGRASGIAVGDVTAAQVRECVALWLNRDRLANGTINVRLALLSAIGVDCTGCWRSNNIGLKWWLSPAQCDKLLAYLRGPNATAFARPRLVADYVEWVSHVGMRVEETLRLTWDDVHLDFRPERDPHTGEVVTDAKTGRPVPVSQTEVTVPGTKTHGSQATIAIGLAPAVLLLRRRHFRIAGESRVFPISYAMLNADWQLCREFLGVADNPLSTLKALRRTAARHLTVKGMPLDILRGYLRHSSSRTTEGYLRLVGGYSPEEQRRWL